MVYIVLSLLLVLILAWYLWAYTRRQQRYVLRIPRTIIEFWVYAETPALPAQGAVVDWIRRNPGIAKHVGNEEALILSDIRFSLGTVLREKNPYLFQGGVVLETDASLPEDFRERIARAVAIHTIRFVAEEPQYNEREAAAIRLCASCAVAIANIARGTLVVDVESQSAWAPEHFQELVSNDPLAFDWNVAVREIAEEDELVYLTRGLAKRGVYDIVVPDVAPDERTVTKSLLENVAQRMWQNPLKERPSTIKPMFEKFFDMHFLCLWYAGQASRERHRSPWVNCRFVRFGSDEELEMDSDL